ncbi:MAG: aquaporin [Verrucomicrobiota bacterium]|nr:aquaporin [Verrucomicrobiota bacterium]
MSLFKSCTAEAVGVFALTFIGAGSIIIDKATGGSVGLLGIAIAHGLALSIAVSTCMNISGGHINPAISIGLFTIGRMKALETLAYVIAQVLGAVVAGLCLKGLFPADAAAMVNFGTPTPSDLISGGTGAVILIEAIATFLLAWAIYGTACGSKGPQGLGGFGVGLTVAMLILAIGPLTGGAMNPARHFGTAIFGGQVGNIWIYWVGPVIGAIAGFQLFSRILEPKQ